MNNKEILNLHKLLPTIILWASLAIFGHKQPCFPTSYFMIKERENTLNSNGVENAHGRGILPEKMMSNASPQGIQSLHGEYTLPKKHV
jgi:hypothetical protein